MSEMFRLVSISLPSSSLPDIRSFLLCTFPYFRKFPSFIFHHFHFISGLFRRLISGNFVIHISSFPLHVRMIPLFIFHHFRATMHVRNVPSCFHLASQSIIAGCPKFSFFVCSRTSGNFRHSYIIISVSFPDDSGVLLPEIPSFIFHPFRFISGWFRRRISGISVIHISSFPFQFPDYSVVLLPEIAIIHS